MTELRTAAGLSTIPYSMPGAEPVPELPDVVAYLTALEPRVVGRRLESASAWRARFVLRSVDPPVAEAEGRTVVGLRRVGKRIVLALEGGIFVVIHLMIAGRLHWRPAGTRPPGRVGLAALDFRRGTLMLHRGWHSAPGVDPPGAGEAGARRVRSRRLDVLTATTAEFRKALPGERHTLKRSLTDPHLLDGIGNAYADEDPAPGEAVARPDDGPAEGRRDRAAPRGGARRAHRVGRAPVGDRAR